MVGAEIFLRNIGESLGSWAVVPIPESAAIAELVANKHLRFDEAMALSKALLETLDMCLFLFVKRLSAHDASIAATKDEELTISERHIQYDFISIFATVSGVCKIGE